MHGADFVQKTDSRSASKHIPHVLENGEDLLHFTWEFRMQT